MATISWFTNTGADTTMQRGICRPVFPIARKQNLATSPIRSRPPDSTPGQMPKPRRAGVRGGVRAVGDSLPGGVPRRGWVVVSPLRVVEVTLFAGREATTDNAGVLSAYF